MLAGATFAIAAEFVGGLAGWWPVPQHSEVTLKKAERSLSSLRSRTLAGPVERTRQRVAVFTRSLPNVDNSRLWVSGSATFRLCSIWFNSC